MNLNDIYLLSPDLALACAAAAIILLDLFVSRKGALAAVGLVGIAVSIILSVSLWMGVSAEPSGRMAGLFGALSVDKFGLFFKLVIAAAAALVLLMSVGYAKRFERFRAEFYGLLLLSASGMTLLASATELVSIYVALELTALPMAALAAFLRDGRSSESGMKFLILSADQLRHPAVRHGLYLRIHGDDLAGWHSRANRRLGVHRLARPGRSFRRQRGAAVRNRLGHRRIRIQDFERPVPVLGAGRLRRRAHAGNGVSCPWRPKPPDSRSSCACSTPPSAPT